MATTQRPDSQNAGRSQKQSQTQRRTDQDQRTDKQERDPNETIRNDGVEIGDPVPEGDRTVRADNRGQGETGEDEDLPDAGGIEGTRRDHH